VYPDTERFGPNKLYCKHLKAREQLSRWNCSVTGFYEVSFNL